MEKFQDIKFQERDDLREKVVAKCEQYYPESADLEFGYLAAGHGYKGKQYPLEADEDLADMYDDEYIVEKQYNSLC